VVIERKSAATRSHHVHGIHAMPGGSDIAEKTYAHQIGRVRGSPKQYNDE
jgi:hypothetical protein